MVRRSQERQRSLQLLPAMSLLCQTDLQTPARCTASSPWHCSHHSFHAKSTISTQALCTSHVRARPLSWPQVMLQVYSTSTGSSLWPSCRCWAGSLMKSSDSSDRCTRPVSSAPLRATKAPNFSMRFTLPCSHSTQGSQVLSCGLWVRRSSAHSDFSASQAAYIVCT